MRSKWFLGMFYTWPGSPEEAGWVGETGGVNCSVPGPLWQGPGVGSGRWSELTAHVSHVHERHPGVAEKLV